MEFSTQVTFNKEVFLFCFAFCSQGIKVSHLALNLTWQQTLDVRGEVVRVMFGCLLVVFKSVPVCRAEMRSLASRCFCIIAMFSVNRPVSSVSGNYALAFHGSSLGPQIILFAETMKHIIMDMMTSINDN